MPLLYGSTYLLMQSGRGGYVCVAEAEDDRNGGQRGRESAIGTHASGLIKDKVGARLGQDRASDTVVKLSNLIAVRAATERYNSNHGEISHYLLRRKSIAGICEWSDHSYFGVRSVVRTSRSPLLDGFLSGLLLRALHQHSNGAIGDFLWHHRPTRVAEVVPAGSPRRGRHISDTAGTGMGGVAPAGQ